MMCKKVVLVACALALFASCKKTDGGGTGIVQPVAYPLTAGIADEASGITDSKANPGALWVQQDGGNPAELILLSHTAQLLKKIPFKGITNRDWEDITLAAGPDAGRNYLYLAETGDNTAVYGTYVIYRMEEPLATTDTVRQVDAISFQYPDGPHDAEAILVEPGTLHIYIITKRDAKSRIYKLSYPYSTTAVNSVTAAGDLPYNFVVSAAITPDGKGVAVKDYQNIYYYMRNAGESLQAVLARTYTRLSYTMEQQGEAICFSNDGKSYFTLSEKLNAPVSLVVYPK